MSTCQPFPPLPLTGDEEAAAGGEVARIHGQCATWCELLPAGTTGTPVADHGPYCARSAGRGPDAADRDGRLVLVQVANVQGYMHGTYPVGTAAPPWPEYVRLELSDEDDEGDATAAHLLPGDALHLAKLLERAAVRALGLGGDQ